MLWGKPECVFNIIITITVSKVISGILSTITRDFATGHTQEQYYNFVCSSEVLISIPKR